MPIYEMTAPNGKTYEIEGPEGATDEQIRDEILRQFPEAEPGVHTRTGKVTPEDDNSLAQLAGVVSGALAPYATAAGLGAAAGAPLAGVGAIPGAAAGVLSLGLSDLATGAYNLAAPMLGAEQAALPSQTIRQTFQDVGIGRAPVNPEQRILSEAMQALAGGVAAPAALGTTAARMAPSTTRSIMQTLAQAPREQAAASVGAAVAPAVAREAGVTNPLALTGLSLAGGMAAGRVATPKPAAVTAESLAEDARQAYDTAKNAGVRFDEAAVSGLASEIRRDLTSLDDIQFNPRLHPRISTALDELDQVAQSGQPISFSQVEMARRVANTAGRSVDPDERRLSRLIIDKIDEFIAAPPANAVVAGDAPEAALAISNARTAWRRKRQSEDIGALVERAANTDQGVTSASLRSQFRTVVNNPRRLRQFDPDIQKLMKDFVKGKGGVATLQAIGNITPGTNLRGLIAGAGLGGAAATGGLSPVAALALAGGGATSRAIANKLASGQVEKIASAARGGAATKQVPIPQAMSASLLQAFANNAPPGEVLKGVGYNADGTPYPQYGPAGE